VAKIRDPLFSRISLLNENRIFRTRYYRGLTAGQRVIIEKWSQYLLNDKGPFESYIDVMVERSDGSLESYSAFPLAYLQSFGIEEIHNPEAIERVNFLHSLRFAISSQDPERTTVSILGILQKSEREVDQRLRVSLLETLGLNLGDSIDDFHSLEYQMFGGYPSTDQLIELICNKALEKTDSAIQVESVDEMIIIYSKHNWIETLANYTREKLQFNWSEFSNLEERSFPGCEILLEIYSCALTLVLPPRLFISVYGKKNSLELRTLAKNIPCDAYGLAFKSTDLRGEKADEKEFV